MAIYFIDFQYGDFLYTDEEGSYLENFEQACEEAIVMLSQTAKDELPSGEHCEFIATIRDEQSTKLYRATLTFHGERLI